MRESSTVPVCGSTAVTLNFLPSTFQLVGVLQPELGGHVGPHEDFVVFQGLDDPLAGQRLLVLRSHHADRGPAADRAARRCPPRPRPPWPGTRSWAGCR